MHSLNNDITNCAYPIIQRNAYLFHSENLLIEILADEIFEELQFLEMINHFDNVYKCNYSDVNLFSYFI